LRKRAFEGWMILAKSINQSSNGVASPKFLPQNFWGPNRLTISEQQHFVWDTASLSTKWQDMLEIQWGMAPLVPRIMQVVRFHRIQVPHQKNIPPLLYLALRAYFIASYFKKLGICRQNNQLLYGQWVASLQLNKCVMQVQSSRTGFPKPFHQRNTRSCYLLPWNTKKKGWSGGRG